MYALVGRVRHCGFCVSGQTIRAAADMIRNAPCIPATSMIINLGTVDILHGRELCDMREDYHYLIDTCIERKIVPIITTIAPIANRNHTESIPKKTMLFNNFLLDFFFQYKIIDIYSTMITFRGRTLFDCYQG